MNVRGLNLGTLNDDEYIAAQNVDAAIVEPLSRAYVHIYDAEIASLEMSVDNPLQKQYIKTQVESLICGLNDILKYLEG